MRNVWGSLVITGFSLALLSGCSLAPNGQTNRIRISLPGTSSQAKAQSKDADKASHQVAVVRGLERAQEIFGAVLGISSLQAGNLLPYGLPTASPSPTATSAAGFQCFGINVTGSGINPADNLPKDSCVPAGMPGSGIYGGLVYSATGGEIEVDVPPGPGRVIQVFGIQTDGYCPALSEITSQPLALHPFQYAYELGRSTVDVANDTTVNVSISSNSSSAPRMFCDVAATSSTLSRQWTRLLGAASATVNATGSAVDSSSNVFVVGSTNVAIDTAPQTGLQDFFVTKYDIAGGKLWTKQLGVASKSTYATSTSVDSSGNVYVAGYTNGSLDGNVLTGAQDSFVTKYDTTGTKLWTRQQGVSTKATYTWGISADSSGFVYVTGTTNGNLNANTLIGIQDVFLTKYDSSGNRIWVKQFGAPSATTYSKGISTDSLGNIYIAGYTDGGLDGYVKTGAQDYFITKFDSTGTRVWTRQVGVTSQYTFGTGISVDSSSNVYVTGYTTGPLDGNALTGTQDLFIAKFDTLGTKLWTRLHGAAASITHANAISVDLSGNVYVAGNTNGGLDGQLLHGVTDYFFAKFDSTGLHQSTIQNGTSGASVQGTFLGVDSASHIYVGGITNYGIDGLAPLGTQSGFFSRY
jgi:hypothetical protein